MLARPGHGVGRRPPPGQRALSLQADVQEVQSRAGSLQLNAWALANE